MTTSLSKAVDAAADRVAKWWPALLVFILVLNIFKGVRMPNRWSVTHYLFTYDFGFIKRALWGETLWRVFGSWTASYFFLAAIALAIFVTLSILVVRSALRIASRHNHIPIALVLCASPAIAMFAHLVGYLEQLGYVVLLFVAFSRRSFVLRAALMTMAAAILPFVHEASIFWFGPLTMLAIVAGRRRSAEDAASRTDTRLATALLIGVVWLISTGIVVRLGEHTTAVQAHALRDAKTQFFSIRPRQDAFNTVAIPYWHARADMKRRWRDPATRLDLATSLLTFGPGAIFLTVAAFRGAQRISDKTVRRTAFALLGPAIFTRMLLHLIAWDLHRWNAIAALNAGIAAMLLNLPGRNADEPRATGGLSMGVALAVAFWSLAADPVFFDAYAPAHPPFFWHIQFLMEFFRTWNWDMWIPVVGN